MTQSELHPIRPLLAAPVAVQTELRLPHVGATRFDALVAERGLAHVASVSWKTEADGLGPVLDRAVTTGRSDGCRSALLDLSADAEGDCWAYVVLRRGSLWGGVAAEDPAALDDAERLLRDALPVAEASWIDIAGNYPGPVRAQLADLVDPAFRPSAAGQLLLWHGPPGMGKTHVVRALAWEWRRWCDFHYVTDPEAFFGSADYMLEVLLDECDDEDVAARWRLLVLEDTGELLSAAAKERTGQGLSRFLNVVDGIIGQGLRVLVLVTTNEPLGRLHPAVARPGRCAARIEFEVFGADEASTWLARRGIGASGRVPRTLAELYALAEGRAVPERPPVGFVRHTPSSRD